MTKNRSYVKNSLLYRPWTEGSSACLYELQERRSLPLASFAVGNGNVTTDTCKASSTFWDNEYVPDPDFNAGSELPLSTASEVSCNDKLS